MLMAQDRATRDLGIVVEEVGKGVARFSMPVTATMLNAHDVAHGGFIFALADTAAAYVGNASGQRSVTSHCAITYLAPAREGDRLLADARETYREGRQAMADVVVNRADGTMIAQFRCQSRTIAGSVFDPPPGAAT
ncbi:MAG: hydroxyphenylacetyl-CoA thioesterase PaaI [Acuticoccus sp.]